MLEIGGDSWGWQKWESLWEPIDDDLYLRRGRCSSNTRQLAHNNNWMWCQYQTNKHNNNWTSNKQWQKRRTSYLWEICFEALLCSCKTRKKSGRRLQLVSILNKFETVGWALSKVPNESFPFVIFLIYFWWFFSSLVAFAKAIRTKLMKKSVAAVEASNLFAGKVQLSGITHSNTQMTFLTETLKIHKQSNN